MSCKEELTERRNDLSREVAEIEAELVELREAYAALPETMKPVEKDRYWFPILELQGDARELRKQIKAIDLLLNQL